MNCHAQQAGWELALQTGGYLGRGGTADCLTEVIAEGAGVDQLQIRAALLRGFGRCVEAAGADPLGGAPRTNPPKPPGLLLRSKHPVDRGERAALPPPPNPPLRPSPVHSGPLSLSSVAGGIVRAVSPTRTRLANPPSNPARPPSDFLAAFSAGDGRRECKALLSPPIPLVPPPPSDPPPSAGLSSPGGGDVQLSAARRGAGPHRGGAAAGRLPHARPRH
eukprot:1060648-Prorocentrum_minimum.AAC.2